MICWCACVWQQCGFSVLKLWLGVITAETGHRNGYSNTWGASMFWVIVDKLLGTINVKPFYELESSMSYVTNLFDVSMNSMNTHFQAGFM